MARPLTDTRLIVQVWLGTRLLFALVALWVAVTQRLPLTNVVSRWDVLHFYEIAAHGYAQPTEMAFFPGLPLVLRAGTLVGVPMAVTGVLLALACSLAAALALGRLGGTWAAVAWLLAPTGVFTAVPYTEAPFCAAAFWAWVRASERRWGAAAVLAALACTLRVSGLFLVGALVVLAVMQWWEGREARRARSLRSERQGADEPRSLRSERQGADEPSSLRSERQRASRRVAAPEATGSDVTLWRPLAWLLLPTAVLGAFAVYLYTLTGSWTAWFSAQAAGWQRGFHWPWEAVQHTWDSLWWVNPAHPEWVWIFRAELLSWCVGLALTLVLLARRRFAEAVWVGVQVLAFSLSYWLMSVNRALLLWFPLWTSVGEVVAGRRGRGWAVAGWAVAVAALGLQGVWAWLYFTSRWAS